MSRPKDLRRLHEEVNAAKAAYTTAQNEVGRLLKLPARSPEAVEALRIAHQILHDAMDRYRQSIEALNR